MDDIRLKVKVEPVITDLSSIGSGKAAKPGQSPVPGFYLDYTGKTPREAQQVCTELTSILVGENLKSVRARAKGTSDVLSAGLKMPSALWMIWTPSWRVSRSSTSGSFREKKKTT